MWLSLVVWLSVCALLIVLAVGRPLIEAVWMLLRRRARALRAGAERLLA